MKKAVILVFLFWSALAQAQVLKPYTLQFSLSRKEVKVGETVDVLIDARMNPGWHIFSSDQDPDVGPLPAVVKFKKNGTFETVGKLRPSSTPTEKMDEIFGGKVRYFEGKGGFKQTIRILKEGAKIEGSLGGQVCQDDGLCIAINDGDFSLANLKVLPGEAPKEEKKNEAITDTVSTVPPVSAPTVTTDNQKDTATTIASAAPASPEQPEEKKDGISFGDLVLAFLAGLAAVAMPCVYPMIPMTVAMFTKRVDSRAEGITKALFYGLSIILIFAFFGTLVSAIFGSAFVNFISTHWAPNLFIFAIFVLFSLSFLGAFELTLPSAFVNKVDAQADKGGWGGIFFMAFAQALVSFSCTAPIVGTAAILAAKGSIWDSALLNVSFGSAFALPFVAAAFIPSFLKSMPKSGGWLNTLKVQLGFLELAIALKFLSVPDQTYHWGLLNRDVYLSLWIVIFTMMGLNLLGKLRMSHDSPLEAVTIPRALFAILIFSFSVYLVPGLFGAPLKPLSGLLPPETSQEFNLSHANGAAAAPKGILPADRKYADFLKLPHGLEGFFDYKEGLAYAQKVGKPIFIDFTGHGCVNCRKMEETVWSQPEVLKRLREDYVIVSLYVDDKTELPESAHYVSRVDGKLKTTIGDQNLDFEIEKYNFNAQPLYVLIDPKNDAKPLVKAVAYEPNVEKFIHYLDEGKAKFNN
ncbi:MAG: thioredoxin family protein [Siphonobacter aquaeclarae]|nr:thioredoxin family protein [Siphonobacter aquaeclarae]